MQIVSILIDSMENVIRNNSKRQDNENVLDALMSWLPKLIEESQKREQKSLNKGGVYSKSLQKMLRLHTVALRAYVPTKSSFVLYCYSYYNHSNTDTEEILVKRIKRFGTNLRRRRRRRRRKKRRRRTTERKKRHGALGKSCGPDTYVYEIHLV